jgi:hypothetical protein
MQVWVVCVFGFFAAAELYHWLQGIALPLPVYGVAGLLLAVVSNVDHWQPVQPQLQPNRSTSSIQPTAQPIAKTTVQAATPAPAIMPPQPEPASLSTHPEPQLPNFTVPSAEISFTIAKPSQSANELSRDPGSDKVEKSLS